MCEVGIFSYGAAEEGQSDGGNVARLNGSFEECLFLSLLGQDLLEFAVVDGIDADAAVSGQGLVECIACGRRTHKTVAAALYHRRQT